MHLTEKIKNRSAIVGVIGLGYLGLPLAIQFKRSGFPVIGFDINAERIKSLNQGRSYINIIPEEDVRFLKHGSEFKATTQFSHLEDADCIIICVPVPLTIHRDPDMSYVMRTSELIAKHLKKGQLIVLESTTYPGATEEDVRSILESTGLKAGRDFHLAFSPRREDPNNRQFSTISIPKIVSGHTPECLKVADALYSAAIKQTVPVSSTRVAEAAKLLESIYRAVNIALVNELKMLFDRMGIDIFEVIDAAKTKPFGFQAFYPGPGPGGNCIPIDPFYLTWKAREYGFHTKFIELAAEINNAMPYYVVNRVMKALNRQGKSIKSTKILVLGLSYKKDVDDVRESPSFKLIELMMEQGAHVEFNDPFIPATMKVTLGKSTRTSVEITKASLKAFDCVVIATDHSAYDYAFIVANSSLIVDTRNATGNLAGPPSKKQAIIVKA